MNLPSLRRLGVAIVLASASPRVLYATSTCSSRKMSTMKAVKLSAPTNAQGITVKDIPIPKPNKGEVLIKNTVAGLNFIDTYHRSGLYANPSGLLGVEGAGEVVEAENATLIGKRVAYIMSMGSYAEYTAVHADKIVVLPDDITYETAMGLMMGGLTAHYLVFDCARATKDSWLLVQAAGSGTSNMVTQIASKVVGANVVGTSSTSKMDNGYKRGGAKVMVDYTDKEGLAQRVRSHTPNQGGFDAVIDGVGKSTYVSSLDSLKPRGMTVFYGAASGPIPPLELTELVRRGSLFLSRPSLKDFVSTREELNARVSDIFSWWKRGLLLLEVDREFALSEVSQAHEYMESGKTKGKVIIRIRDEENFVQATFDAAMRPPHTTLHTLVLGGDGRFFNDIMCQTIIKMAHANGIQRVIVGQHGLLSTPAVSHLMRREEAQGAFILTASHNPGGPDNDVGIKFNTAGGGPAPEALTDAIYKNSLQITSYKISDELPNVPLDRIADIKLTDSFLVQVISSTSAYVTMVNELFDMPALQRLFARPDFSFVFDAMSGAAGPYAIEIFHKLFGVPKEKLFHCIPSPDFDGGHPDPNLTYAHHLVHTMGLTKDGSPVMPTPTLVPDFGAAADGDADRNMILGRQFFVTPSDSLAVLASKITQCVPYFKTNGLKAVARSMPTSAAVDIVAKSLGIPVFEVPTGWKFFVNLCDARELGKGDYTPLLCGEESFGTGSNHMREKDGLFAVLCWLSVLAMENSNPTKPLVSVKDIVERHWKEFGRNHYQRFDYEECESSRAAKLTAYLTSMVELMQQGKLDRNVGNGFVLSNADEFQYVDPVDASVSRNQGWRFLLEGGSRFVFRLSGTGSSGATVRLYLERYTPSPGKGGDEAMLLAPSALALKSLADSALKFSKLSEFLGREEPTVIT